MAAIRHLHHLAGGDVDGGGVAAARAVHHINASGTLQERPGGSAHACRWDHILRPGLTHRGCCGAGHISAGGKLRRRNQAKQRQLREAQLPGNPVDCGDHLIHRAQESVDDIGAKADHISQHLSDAIGGNFKRLDHCSANAANGITKPPKRPKDLIPELVNQHANRHQCRTNQQRHANNPSHKRGYGGDQWPNRSKPPSNGGPNRQALKCRGHRDQAGKDRRQSGQADGQQGHAADDGLHRPRQFAEAINNRREPGGDGIEGGQ